MTYPSTIVLYAVANGVRHGFDIVDASGLRAGTVYLILRRLEAEGLVTSAWERPQTAHAHGRPPRRNYRITAQGSKTLEAALLRYRGVPRVLEWKRGGATPESA